MFTRTFIFTGNIFNSLIIKLWCILNCTRLISSTDIHLSLPLVPGVTCFLGVVCSSNGNPCVTEYSPPSHSLNIFFHGSFHCDTLFHLENLAMTFCCLISIKRKNIKRKWKFYTLDRKQQVNMTLCRGCWRWNCVLVMKWLGPVPHWRKIIGSGAFLCGVSTFSLCMCGYPPSAPTFFTSPKTCVLG